MSHIVLTEQQARVVAAAGGVVEVHDSEGRPFASLRLLCPDNVEEAARNGGAQAGDAPPPSAATEQVPVELALKFCWSKGRQTIRAAVKEFVEQTHADY